jgi:hypothetical protein
MPRESENLNAVVNRTIRSAKIKAAKIAPDVRHVPTAKKWPLIEEGMRLSDEVMARPWQDRPMVWSDLPLFEARHGRNAHDMVYDLGMHQANHYRSRVGLHEVLPFDIELLVRLYDRSPSSCMWTCPTLQDMFFRIYGQAIEGFAPSLQDRARNAYGMRFARLMGRAPTVQYRWLWDSGMQDKSGSTRRVRNIISKLHEASLGGEHPRAVLEDLAGRMWVLRGLNVDAETPAHDPISLQKRSQKVAKGSSKEDARLASGHSGKPAALAPAVVRAPVPAYEGGAFALGDD